MPMEDWRDQEAERSRRDRWRDRDRDDYGQADYSDLYGYDPRTRSGYRAYDDGRESDRYDEREQRRYYAHEPRSYEDDRPRRDSETEARYEREERRERRDSRRREPSDRVLWAVITERLEDERRLDLRDVEVSVRDGEVTLDGTVRHKADKRRIEDVADIEGVRNVQNNLRVRERSRWTFL